MYVYNAQYIIFDNIFMLPFLIYSKRIFLYVLLCSI